MLGTVFETAAVLDYFLEGDARPTGCANGAFAPGSVDQLVAFAWVLVDLLDSASAGALQRDDVGLAREERFILEVG